jgi:hypothetical protein
VIAVFLARGGYVLMSFDFFADVVLGSAAKLELLDALCRIGRPAERGGRAGR